MSYLKINKTPKYFAAIIYFLLITTIRSTGLRFHRDLMFDDETGNLISALLKTWNSLDPEGGALYILWLKFLALLIHDPINLAYYNWSILHFLASTLCFFNLISFRVPFKIAITATTILGFTGLFEMGPFASLFATVFLLGSFFATSFINDRITRLFALAPLVLISGYIRPEMVAASVIVLLSAVVISIFQRRSKIILVGAALYTVVLFGLGNILGFANNPFKKIDNLATGRATVAFSTLYAFSYVERNKIQGVDPWRDWEKIMDQNFPGKPLTMTQIFFANPKEFLVHVGYNMKNLYRFARLFVPEIPISKSTQTIFGAIFLLVVGLALVLKLRKVPNFHKAWTRLPDNFQEFCLFSLCILANNIAAILIIFPRYHYLVVSSTLVSVIVIKLLSFDLFDLKSIKNTYFIFALSLFILTAPARNTLTPWWLEMVSSKEGKAIPEGLESVQTLKSIEGLKHLANISILEPDNSRLIYSHHTIPNPSVPSLSENCRQLIPCINREHFDIIALESRLRLQYQSVDPQGLDVLDRNPQSLGYHRIPTQGGKSAILIRMDLLEK